MTTCLHVLCGNQPLCKVPPGNLSTTVTSVLLSVSHSTHPCCQQKEVAKHNTLPAFQIRKAPKHSTLPARVVWTSATKNMAMHNSLPACVVWASTAVHSSSRPPACTMSALMLSLLASWRSREHADLTTAAVPNPDDNTCDAFLLCCNAQTSSSSQLGAR